MGLLPESYALWTNLIPVFIRYCWFAAEAAAKRLFFRIVSFWECIVLAIPG